MLKERVVWYKERRGCAKHEGVKHDVDGITKEFLLRTSGTSAKKALSEKKRMESSPRAPWTNTTNLSEVIMYANMVKDVQMFNYVMVQNMKESFHIWQRSSTCSTLWLVKAPITTKTRLVSSWTTLALFSRKIQTTPPRLTNSYTRKDFSSNSKTSHPHFQHKLAVIQRTHIHRHELLFQLHSYDDTHKTQLNLPNNMLCLLSGKSHNKLFV